MAGTNDGGNPGVPYSFLLVGIDITSPASNAMLGSAVTVTGTASCTQINVAADGSQSSSSANGKIDKVEVKFGSGSYLQASTSGGSWTVWSKTKSLTVSGPMTITAKVTATDDDGHTFTATASVSVQVDVTAPSLTIDSPLEGTTFTWTQGGVPVTLAGTVSDALSGLSTVEWDLNGQNQYSPANFGGGTWNAAVTLPSAGDHTITVRARDQKGNETVRSVHLSVAVTFDPADPQNVVSLASYLGDLLDYSGVRAKSSSGGPTLTRPLLAGTFHQPFDELTDPSLTAVTDEAVPQVRVAVEVLRRYFTDQNLTLPPADESAFLWEAYTAVLRRLGTSYDEVRLARVADAETREALAARLGLALAPARPDHLDELVLDPVGISEDDLETLFGLRKTSQDPFTAGVVPEAQLLTWQRTRLGSLWQQLDADAGPILDPDVVAEADLRDASGASPAYSLLDARAQWVAGRLAFHQGVREAEATPLAGFDAVVSGVLGPVANLLALYDQHNEGEDVRPQLAVQPISLAAFLYLLRVRELANTGAVLDSEWQDVYSILVAVEKERQDETWKSEEAAVGLVLGPDEFVLADTAPALPRWRAGGRDRRDWVSKLAARFEQEDGVVEALRSAVTAAEEETLPALRDAMVQAARPNQDPQEAADELTLTLAIDMKTSGTEKATRLSQGIATLQSVLFSLRTGRYVVPHPAAAWVLDLSASYTESDFDQEWRWMGSYDTWRAAMMVFGYPESYLLPSLREAHAPNQDPSQAYADLVARLRETPRLSPAQARAEAAAYLADLRAEVALPSQLMQSTFTITDELTEAQLAERRTLIQTLFGAVTDPHLAPNYLKEVFYFVPMLLARQLQQVRQFLAALDWYQTVYAYNLKVSDRKIYRGLVLEESITTQYQRTLDWLLEGLNPHDVVVVRANAYTRFTLLSLVRCFLEYANSEFARDTTESIPRARALYVTALDLLDLPEMQHDEDSPFPANPVLGSLRLNAELNLFKLRSGRNFAGMKRQTALTVPRSVSISALPAIGEGGLPAVPGALTFHPTAYRYSALIERAKQLVAIAQQVEGVYLAALEKFDAESYNLLRARQDLQLSRAGVRLQELRLDAANDGVHLAELQRTRAEIESSHYQGLLDEGLIGQEKSALSFMAASAALQVTAAALTAAGGFLNLGRSILTLGFGDPAKDAAAAASSLAGAASTAASISQTMASYERRKEEWRHQLDLAQHGLVTADAQITIAQDQVLVTGQEHLIAEMQADSAADTVQFLVNKFTSAELYQWMSGVLGQVYSYFLQQATAVAELAQHQLAFERQEHPPAFIQADYWQLPAEAGSLAGESSADRRGLTGSARLLQDIYQLDQHAFETNQRKLQLSQTFSLAQLAPAEFQRFRETGVLPFSIPMEVFDRDFPGHYLRLIKRVRVSMIALIPPTRGIRATLATSGLSRVVVGKAAKQAIAVRRDPEVVALTSAVDATGVFELQGEGDMLLPFEGLGVDTSWELRLPKAANPFDYNSLGDVLFTVEYTALSSGDYEQQVVSGLPRNLKADRPYSFRHQLADAWFDLNNPEQSATPMTVTFETRREDFPPNLEELKVRQVMLYVARKDGTSFEVAIDHLHFTPQGEAAAVGGGATTVDGAVSTRRSNGVNWLGMTDDKSPVGTWELALPDTVETKDRFTNEEIEDLLLVVSYQGETPAWPA